MTLRFYVETRRIKTSADYIKLALLTAEKFQVQRQHGILGHAGHAQCFRISYFLLFINGNLLYRKILNIYLSQMPR